MKKKRVAAIILYIALVILCVAVVYIVPSVRGLLEKTYVTEYGTISITDEVSGYILRDEDVYVASQDFEIKRLAEHNVLIKARTGIVEVTAEEDAEAAEATETEENAEDQEVNVHRKYKSLLEDLGDNTIETKNGKSVDAGYISYYLDGAESMLSTSRLMDLSENELKSLTKRKQVDMPDTSVRKGEPLFKVTKNGRWYLVFYLDNEEAEKYYAGRTVTINIEEEDVTVKVAYTEPGDKKTKIALSCKHFYEGFLETRRLETVVTVAKAEGLVLKDISLVEKDGQIGVFVKNKLGEHVFKPISIKADNGEECVAYSDIFVDEGGNFVETIGTYDEIVEEPSPEEVAALNEGAESEKDN